MKTLIRPLGAAAVAFALLAGGTATAQAYNLSGGHLPTTSPSYKINGGSSASRTAWSAGVSDWNNAGAGVSPSTTSGSATVALSEANDSSVSWDGITYWNNGANGVMTNVSAQLNAAYTAGYSASKREGVAAHEVGHTLGLAHSNSCVLMNPTTPDRTNCGVYTPQQDDINGVRAIYGASSRAAAQSGTVMHLSQAESFKDLTSLHRSADAVVVASVGGQSSTVKDGIPFTDHNLKVRAWLKGGSSTGSATVHQTGGTVDGALMQDDRDPLLQEGQTGIYFLRQYAPGKFFIIGGADGRFEITAGNSVSALASSNVKDVSGSLSDLVSRTQGLTRAEGSR